MARMDVGNERPGLLMFLAEDIQLTKLVRIMELPVKWMTGGACRTPSSRVTRIQIELCLKAPVLQWKQCVR